jgi:integrase/recombinase XerD
LKAYLEPHEIEQLEIAAAFLRDKLLIRLLFRLGCRVTEALGLTFADVDWSQSIITIQHLKTRTKLSCPDCSARLGKVNKFCPVCGIKVEQVVTMEKEHRRFRRLPMDVSTLEMLKEYFNTGQPDHFNESCLIFGISRHRAWQIVKDCAAKAGLPKIINTESGKVHNVSPHRLRDAFAVHAVKSNDSIDAMRLLQEHLGHASFNTTAKYRKISGEEHQHWYQNLWKE